MVKHGHARRGRLSRSFMCWSSMLQRCNNPRRKDYHRYGGRGIAVCDRWLVFTNFLSDMGEPPSGMSLDRIDPNGNYEPGGCCWATPKQQTDNRRPRERAPRAKLFAADVAQIRALKGIRLQRQVAQMFGVNRTAISNIWRGKTWKELSHQSGVSPD